VVLKNTKGGGRRGDIVVSFAYIKGKRGKPLLYEKARAPKECSVGE
jgi:hypothetical protein